VPTDPSDAGLPALPRARGLANSLEQARPGQAFAVDEKGNVVGHDSKAMRHASLRILGVYAAGSVFMLAAAAVFGRIAGPVALVATLLGLLAFTWPARRLAHALRSVAADDLVEAERTGVALASSRFASRMVRGNAWLIAGSAAWLRGELATAIGFTRRAIEQSGYPPTGTRRAIGALARLNEIQLLAITGDLAAARARLAELDRDGLPAGDLVQMQRIDTDLVLAFEGGDASVLPDDLDEWVAMVLRTNRFGSTLVLLAWAQTLRGETELAATLLDVAVDRLPECHIDAAHPRLAAWLQTVRT